MELKRNSGFPPPHLRHWRSKSGQFPVRIMSVVEGYVVARRPNAIPFLLTIQQFSNQYEIVPQEAGVK